VKDEVGDCRMTMVPVKSEGANLDSPSGRFLEDGDFGANIPRKPVTLQNLNRDNRKCDRRAANPTSVRAKTLRRLVISVHPRDRRSLLLRFFSGAAKMGCTCVASSVEAGPILFFDTPIEIGGFPGADLVGQNLSERGEIFTLHAALRVP
jgi:hypothetical protein